MNVSQTTLNFVSLVSKMCINDLLYLDDNCVFRKKDILKIYLRSNEGNIVKKNKNNY